MKTHYSEADLLETYYTQPGESMPVMMHLASCSECAARYERLQRKLRDAAACPAKPATFWSWQRASIMRRIGARRQQTASAPRTWRVAAAALLAFFLGGALVYEVEPRKATVVTTTASATKESIAATADLAVDPWQSDELKDFHGVVQWESWVGESSL